MTKADVAAVARMCLERTPLPPAVESGLERLLWRLMERYYFLGGVVERLPAPGRNWQLAAFGYACFMNDELSQRYFSEPFPFVAAEVLECAAEGHEDALLLSREQVAVRQEAAEPSLNLLIPLWLQDNEDPNSGDAWQLMHHAFRILDAYIFGFRLRSVVFEGLARNRPFFDVAGYAKVIDFTEEDVNSPYAYLRSDPRYEPQMHGIHTLQDFREKHHATPAARLFAFRDPILGLTDRQKAVLDLAVEGFTDKDIAKMLNLRRNAVTMRWRAIYARMEKVLPEIFDSVTNLGDAARGQEKRRIAVRYIWEHPEEIRPWMYIPDMLKED